jgi:hypothetical protein
MTDRSPSSTYRLQITPGFTLVDAVEVLDHRQARPRHHLCDVGNHRGPELVQQEELVRHVPFADDAGDIFRPPPGLSVTSIRPPWRARPRTGPAAARRGVREA